MSSVSTSDVVVDFMLKFESLQAAKTNSINDKFTVVVNFITVSIEVAYN